VFAVVHIPNFSLQAALRHEPELHARAVALIDAELPKLEIIQLTPAARDQGVVAGSTASQATARCGDLFIRTRSRAAEQTATEVVGQTAYAFSPNIELTASGVCTLELKGLGLETETAAHQWAAKLLQTLAMFHLEAQIGIASTPALALLAAQAANPFLFMPDSTAFIAALPLEALSPPPEMAAILSRWGIRTAGEFLRLGVNEIAERLGHEALELFARVSPHSMRPLKLVAPREVFSERMEFEIGIETIEPLLFVLRRFVEQLARRVETVYLVVAEFHLRLGLASGAHHERTFKIPAPTARVETLFRMLQTHLETVRTDAPIVALELVAKPGRAELHQFGLFESTLRNPNQFAETLARLTALLGTENVGTPQIISTNRPDTFRLAPPQFDAAYEKDLLPLPLGGEGRGEGARPQVHGRLGLQLRRFRPPLPAQLEFRKEKPALLRSEVFIGAITDTRGPFLSSGDWWDTQRWAREEWDIETGDGSLLRVFRSADGCFVEGVYD
jgi:protein ImuB